MTCMNGLRWNRWGGASGFAALVVGIAGGAMERGWPSASDPAAVATFVASNRTAILAQSMFFLASSGIYIWFLGALRDVLFDAEGGNGPLSTIVFGAGMVWIAISMLAQAFQVGITMAADSGVQPVMMWTMAATFAIANLPCAIMLVTTAVASFKYQAFPNWLGWISLMAGMAQGLLWAGTVIRSGPLAPNGWLTYTLYPLLLFWLVPTAVVMFKRGTLFPKRAG